MSLKQAILEKNPSQQRDSLVFLPHNSNSSSTSEDDLRVIEQLSNSNNPIFLVYSLKQKRHYAMKIFKYKNNQVTKPYRNEARFSSVRHPNIMSVLSAVDHKMISLNGVICPVSYILMEVANCDFLDLIHYSEFANDEKLARTYFHQLIEGLEFLHSQGLSHMDLKPENLLLGKDYKLKITDFDLSFKKGDSSLSGKGTIEFRAPEVKNKTCKNTEAADVYSAGIVLFVLKVGYLPYLEEQSILDFDMLDLMLNCPENFWLAHAEIDQKINELDEDFKSLFISMVRKEPHRRASLEKIKSNRWYQGPTYNEQELKELMESILEGSVLHSF